MLIIIPFRHTPETCVNYFATSAFKSSKVSTRKSQFRDRKFIALRHNNLNMFCNKILCQTVGSGLNLEK